MEKLIELLNEYINTIDWWDDLNEYNDVDILDGGTLLEVNWRYHDIEYLYTKRFGFIKWLVDNDKIETNKYENILDRIEYYSQSEEEQKRHYYSDYESLLMLLAIQDEPIEFLISILK